MAAGTQPRERISYDIADVVRPQKQLSYKMKLQTIDRQSQRIMFTDQTSLSYDYLIVALGFESESFGIPGVNENALEMVDVDSAETIYHHLLKQMKEYKNTRSRFIENRRMWGGFTGVELLGSLVENRKEFC